MTITPAERPTSHTTVETDPSTPARDRADVSTPGERIQELDVLRGFALCGIVVINVIQQLVFLRGDTDDRTFPLPVELLFYERFMPTFAVLFGVGFGIFLRRAAARADRPRVVLARRLAVLLVLGLVHWLFHPGEALATYALVGLVLLLPVSFLGARAVLAIAVALLFVGPQIVVGYGMIPGLILLGYALAMLDVPENLGRRPGRIAVALAVFGAVGATWAALRIADVDVPAVNVIGGLGGGADLLGPIAAVCTAFAYCCLVLLLLRTPAGPVINSVLAPMGRMALTNYLTATALFLVFGALLGIDSLADGAAIAGLTIGIIVVQAVWSRLWLASFRYGPLEWAWRCLTWWRRAPLRR